LAKEVIRVEAYLCHCILYSGTVPKLVNINFCVLFGAQYFKLYYATVDPMDLNLQKRQQQQKT
jgi:hypothetical protein